MFYTDGLGVPLDFLKNWYICQTGMLPLQRARTYYDISDQVVIDSDDYPTLQSIQTITKIYLQEVINQMYP